MEKQKQYEVTVRWVAETRVRVMATDGETAEEMVREDGLPWSVAEEGDDGGSTTFSAWEVQP